MYQQKLKIGEGQVACVIEYTVDDTYCVVERIWSPKGEDVTGLFAQEQIEDIGERLDIGHDDVLRELAAEYRADAYADRIAFQEAYA